MKVSAHNLGFTLVELVTVIIILGIVSVGVSGFIRSGAQIFVDSTERDQLLSDSRFVIERLNRELRNALPNSVQLADNGAQDCIEFVPIGWSTFYSDIPVLPEPEGNADIVELFDYAGNSYAFASSGDPDFAVVYATSTAHVYNTTLNRRKQITSCSDAGSTNGGTDSCATQDDPNHSAELDIGTDRFDTDSPASRLFIVRDRVSYCVDYASSSIFRYQDGIDDSIYSADATLMAESIANQDESGDQPFAVNNATLTRNAMVTVMLRFERNDEIVEFNNEVHIANVP